MANEELWKQAADEARSETLKALEAQGITTPYLVKKLKRELNAKTTKFFQHEGKVTAERSVVDWSTRQKARMDAHTLRGDYPAAKHQVTGAGGGPIQFNDVSVEQRERLLAAQVETMRIMANGKKGDGRKKG
jgi:hypothetical protein